MRVYYAHCMALYNTPQEKRDVVLLRKLGFEVVNPNTKECDQGAKLYGMHYFKRFAKTCDLVAFRALPDGAIPSGVALELEWFKELSKPVIELPSGVERRGISREATRQYLREVGWK